MIMEFNKESNDFFGIEWISLENDLVLLVLYVQQCSVSSREEFAGQQNTTILPYSRQLRIRRVPVVQQQYLNLPYTQTTPGMGGECVRIIRTCLPLHAGNSRNTLSSIQQVIHMYNSILYVLLLPPGNGTTGSSGKYY